MKTRTTSIVHSPSSIAHLSGERGVALILTLAIITLVTLLVIAFAVSMRVENAASKNFNDLIKTRELAQGAIDQAVATIRNATPPRTASPFFTYVTFPGMIYDYSGALPAIPFPLYSDPTMIDKTNLNAGLWITGNGEFSSTPLPDPSQFNVGWLYVAEDGTAGPPPLTGHGSLVGRFAFWVDDEASKININTAGKPTAPDTFGYVGQNAVDLSVLLSNMNVSLPRIVSARTPNPYSTLEDVKRPNPSITDSQFSPNRFSLTVYSDDALYPNHDSTTDLDAFGVPRRITSALMEAIDIKNTPPTNVCLYARLLDSLGTTLTKMYGGTFAQKYPVAGGVDGLKQIIANIIAYQDPTATPPDENPASDPPAYLGLAKTPYVNEVKVTYTHDAVAGTLSRKVEVELFYPYGADGSTYTVVAPQTIVVKNLPAFLGLPTVPVIVTVIAGNTFNSGTLYRSYPAPVDTVPAPAPAGSAPAQTIIANYYRAGNRLDCAQVSLPVSGGLSPGGVVWQGAQANDPCVNENTTDWTGYSDAAGGSGTLGSQNSNYAPLETPPSKALMRGDKMKSVGELGFIHQPSVAWKYLTLQPGGGGGVIPDWAILDFFTVDPAVVPVPTMGRININSFINPGLAVAAPSKPRLVPLQALLSGLAASGPLDVYNDLRTDNFGMKDPTTSDPVFDTIGELCEIPSLATGATEADKEVAIRRIANLITVRSNTFTIWVMAQSIKEPNIIGQNFGKFEANDLITGEVKAQAVVERYENPPGSAPKFRTRYFRYLYN